MPAFAWPAEVRAGGALEPPPAVFLRLIAHMAIVALVRLAKGIFEQSDMPISPRLIALGRLTSCPGAAVRA